MTLGVTLANQLGRSDYRGLPDLPLVIVEGAVRSGKSRLLDELDAQWRARVPVVRIALGQAPSDVRSHTIAIAIADELVRRTSVPGHLFKRFFLGVAALEVVLPADPGDAVNELTALLRQRDQVMQAVHGAVSGAREVVSTLPSDAIPHGVGSGLATVDPLTWALRGWRSDLRWFATATGSRTGIDGLVLLNRWHRCRSQQQPADVDAVLLRAFLTDLGSAFTRWRHSDRLTHNALLLIDDVDTPAAGDDPARLRFVADLLALRANGADGPSQGDPLLVVATSGIRTAAGVTGFPFGREVVFPTGPAAVDLTRRSRGRASRAPIHVVDLGDNLPREPGPGNVLDHWCRSLSGGHRWAYERIRKAAAVLPPDREPNIETLLPARLTSEITTIALHRQPLELEPDLWILSAISPHDPHAESAFTAVHASPWEQGIGATEALKRYRRAALFVSRALWSGPRSDGLHPLFRRALLAELSVTPAPVPWDVVFARLAAAHDESSRWYNHYLLAQTGNVLSVTPHLAWLLDRRDAQRWLAELDCITSAPRRRDPDDTADGESTFGAAMEITLGREVRGGLAERERHVAAVVAALWLSRNHRGGPMHEELEQDAARALDRLADASTSNWALSRGLAQRAAEYRARKRFLDDMV